MLLLLCGFATIEQKICYDVSGEVFVDVSGDVSGEVDFATVAHLCCYEISGEVSGEVSGESVFSVFWTNLFCYIGSKSDDYLLHGSKSGIWWDFG